MTVDAVGDVVMLDSEVGVTGPRWVHCVVLCQNSCSRRLVEVRLRVDSDMRGEVRPMIEGSAQVRDPDRMSVAM